MKAIRYLRTADSGLVGRLAKGGAGAFFASMILLALPMMGALFLSAQDYALWALLATIMTATMVVNLGGAPLIQTAVASGTARRTTLLAAIGLSGAGAITVAIPACLLWPQMVARFSVPDEPAPYWIVLLLSFGAALRSAVVVVASQLLAEGNFGRRNVLLVGQATLQAAATLGLLVIGQTLSALALGLLISSMICLAACLPGALKSLPRGRLPASVPVSRFIVARSVASFISLVMTQGDRWALGAVADAGLLRSYDVAARFALMPKAVVTVFFLGLVNEAAQTHGPAARLLLSRAKRVCTVALLSLSAGVLAVALPFGYLVQSSERDIYVVLVVAMLIWSGVHALTGPVTLVLTGRGRPDFELHYLVPCFMTVAAVWWAAVHFSNAALLIAGTGAALFAWSCYFLWQSERYLALSSHVTSNAGASRDAA